MKLNKFNFIFSAIFLISFVLSSTTEDNIFPTVECTTEECKEVSKRVLASLDESINPCEDFYQFSCGGWINNHPLEEGQSMVDGYSITTLENKELLRNLLKSKYKPRRKYTNKEKKYDENVFNKIKNIYETCLNIKNINKKSNKPMLNLLKELKINKKRKSYSSVKGLTELIITLHNRAVPLFFDISNIIIYSVEDDVFHVSVSEKGSYINNEEFTYFDTTYRNYIHDTLELIFKGSKRNIDDMTNAIVNFEYELSNIHVKSSSNKQQMTLNEFNEKYPYIDWKLYLKSMFKEHNIKENVTSETPLYDGSPEYFAALGDVISKYSGEAISYYAEWNVIRTFINYLSDDVKKPHIQFEFQRNGRLPVEMDRVDFCDEQIDNLMAMPLGKYFADVVFTDKVREDANNTLYYLRQSMIKRIPKMTWLDDDAKEEAIAKVLNMLDRIGLPDYLKDPKTLYERYESLKTSSSDYFTNRVNYDYYALNKNMKLYKTKYNDDTWAMSPQTLNAYYDLFDNSMNFPAGIFQDPNYHYADPDYMTYGSLGMVFGHELTHAFDGIGRFIDSTGDYRDSWSEESSEKFYELSQCFIDQFSEFYITDNNNEKSYVDGYGTNGENVADYGGVLRAFEAWKLSVENDLKNNPKLVKERNPLLPGLSKYTYEQLFYIAFGQEWCTNASMEYLTRQMTKDEHSPSQFRVNGAVMNNEHFAEVFNCPSGSPMNPKDKCTLW